MERTASSLLKASAMPFDNACVLVERYERLLREARSLILEGGESIEVPTQFRQHAWLNEMHELFPTD